MRYVAFVLLLALQAFIVNAQEVGVASPDKKLEVKIFLKDGAPRYSVAYNGKPMLEESPLGLLTSVGDFSSGMSLLSHSMSQVDERYTQTRIKKSSVRYLANELTCTLVNLQNKTIQVVFRVSNNDVAFRYLLPQHDETACCIVEKELTGFKLPANATTFLTPQALPMTGWKRTKPSYEEKYVSDEPLGAPSQYGIGYTFPALFHVGSNGWVLISETGVRSLYCGSRLSEASQDGVYTVAFPEPGENNGIGNAAPALALPGETPWRTITVADNLKPIVETTIPFDVVQPLYEPSMDYKFGRATWSWIMWQDKSVNYDDQLQYIDLAAAMGYEYVLIDGLWDKQIGYERMPSLFKYAQAKGVHVFLWYNSNGYWSDALQGAKQKMSNSVARKKEMKWLKSLGVKGLKVDFFGGDKQQTMQLYEDILADANEYGLMIIFHGCTLPRGWERMYPNYVGSEAVLASENLIFTQKACDAEAYNACLHPFIRNAVGSMEFGPVLLNKKHNKANNGGSVRRTTDIFQLATAVLFQNAVQMFAVAPNNLTDVPAFEIDFMKKVPTTWDETVFIDGYPGKYCVLARRSGGKWWVVGVNALKENLKLELTLPMLAGKNVSYYFDDKKRQAQLTNLSVKKTGKVSVEMQPDGAVIFTDKEPDSAYIFAYATDVRDGKNGLHLAWSTDKENWLAIGTEYSYVKSDYGRWDTEKRMINPVLFQSPDGLWHCIWNLNHTADGALAYAATHDLVYWGRQSYYADLNGFTKFSKDRVLAERSKQQQVFVNGKPELGTISRVPWAVIDGVLKAQQLATYKKQLWSEVAADDALRFASLQPVDIKVTPQPHKSKKISDMLMGVFFEDLNYAADGGLYAELVQNRDFEYDLSDKVGRDKTWDSKKAWQATGVTFSIDTAAPIHRNNRRYAVLQVGEPGGKLVNEGFDGIAVKAGEKYDFSIFTRVLSGKGGKLTVRLTDKSGKSCGEVVVKAASSSWKKQSAVLTAKATTSDAQLEIIPEMKGEVALDMISLFPQKTFKGRKNGLREDLAQAIADMKPRFVRFPGGCLAHGDGIENMYRWKNTVGQLEARVPQRNLWNYHQTAGLGYFEYFQFCEDIGAEPLPVVPAGVPCQNSRAHHHPLGGQQGGIPLAEMDEYVQEVLDLIEWANGDVKTKWGKVRADAGHPKPFNLKYLGVGNEDLISDVFEERFTMIYNAVKEKYPEVVVIGTVGPFFEGTDYVEGWKIADKLRLPMVDEHYYVPPGWFIYNQDYYDKYDRSKSKVYLGEYASHVSGKKRNLEAALSEALYLTALERNGDVVSMASYAPLLAKEGHVNWNPDLIYFTNTEVKPTVSYHVQKLFGNNAGAEYIPQAITLSNAKENVKNRIAVSLVKDDKTGDVILKMVNMLPVEVRAAVDINLLQISVNQIVKTVMRGEPSDTNVQPVQSTIAVKEVENMTLPPYSFTLVRIQNKF